MPITALPTAPSRALRPADFANQADAFLSQLPTFAAEATTLEQTVNAAEVVVIAAESSAISAKNAAQAAQAAAEAVANATEWTGGTVTAGECRYGSDGQTYRCLVTHTDVDPVGDTTGKWVRISTGGLALLMTTQFEAVVGHRYMIAPGVECTLPATPSIGDQVEVRAAGSREAVTANPPILRRNGNDIQGIDEDVQINGQGSVTLIWAGADQGGWV